ncbi:MAG: GxxExxY protein [Bacteroidales bacterium]|nr:GxxExxY protein [Bacteroidales bacterium]
MNRADLNRLHTKVFEAAAEVHSALGPGLDEEIYRSCFQHELRLHGLLFKRDARFPVFYKDIKTTQEIKAEMLVENHIIVEITSETEINPLRISGMQSKLKATGRRVGIIITFNCHSITDGYRKVMLNP